MLLIIFLILFAAVIIIGISYYFAGSIIRLNRQTVITTPGDVGLHFEKLKMMMPDEVELRGWLIRNDSNKLVVMAHPGGFNRAGFNPAMQGMPRLTDMTVDFLPTAKALFDAGYNVLMFDFRNQGESADTDTRLTGVGLEEYKDIVGVMDYIKKDEDLNEMEVGMLSYCMGANATIIALSKKPSLQNLVKCVVAVQPISTDVFVRSLIRSKYSGLAEKIIYPVVKWMVPLRGGYPLEQMSPLEYVKDLRVPILYVQSKDDPWTEMSDIEIFYEETGSRSKDLFMIEGLQERFSTYNFFGEKPERLIEFLQKYLK